MLKIIAVTALLLGGSVQAQAPASTTMVLSLRTMGKALAACREAYTHTPVGRSQPLAMEVVGKDDYAKDLANLEHAETFANALASDPEKITGKFLVALLSSADDFAVGVGSTRSDLLRHIVIDRKSTLRQEQLMVSAESLNSCQKSLFDASDDFVGLVMDYVGAEDQAVARRRR